MEHNKYRNNVSAALSTVELEAAWHSLYCLGKHCHSKSCEGATVKGSHVSCGCLTQPLKAQSLQCKLETS